MLAHLLPLAQYCEGLVIVVMAKDVTRLLGFGKQPISCYISLIEKHGVFNRSLCLLICIALDALGWT